MWAVRGHLCQPPFPIRYWPGGPDWNASKVNEPLTHAGGEDPTAADDGLPGAPAWPLETRQRRLGPLYSTVLGRTRRPALLQLMLGCPFPGRSTMRITPPRTRFISTDPRRLITARPFPPRTSTNSEPGVRENTVHENAASATPIARPATKARTITRRIRLELSSHVVSLRLRLRKEIVNALDALVAGGGWHPHGAYHRRSSDGRTRTA